MPARRARPSGRTALNLRKFAGVSIALAAVFIIKFRIAETLGAHPLLQPQGELDNAFYLHFAKHVKAGDFWLLSPDSFFGQTPVP